MWILMLDTYAGGIGTFPKGHKLDLPPDIIERLPKGCYKKTCAPWEKEVDKKLVARQRLETEVQEARVWADICQDKADKLKQKEDELVPVVEQKQKELKQAKAADKGRKKLEFTKAHGELTVAIAEQGLMQLRADDAKQKIETAAKALARLEAGSAKKKAQEEVRAKTEAEAEAKANAKAEAKAKSEQEAKAKAEAESKVKAEKAAAETKAKIDANLKSLGINAQRPEQANEEPKTGEPVDQSVDGTIGKQADEPVGKQVDEPVPEGQTVSAREAGQ